MSYNRLDGNLTLTLQICMSYKRFKIWAILYFNYTDTRKNDHVTSKSCFLKSKVLENILRERQTCQGLGDEVCEPSLKDLPFEDSSGDLWLRSDIWGVISLKMYTREEPLTALYVRSRILKSIIIRWGRCWLFFVPVENWAAPFWHFHVRDWCLCTCIIKLGQYKYIYGKPFLAMY